MGEIPFFRFRKSAAQTSDTNEPNGSVLFCFVFCVFFLSLVASVFLFAVWHIRYAMRHSMFVLYIYIAAVSCSCGLESESIQNQCSFHLSFNSLILLLFFLLLIEPINSIPISIAFSFKFKAFFSLSLSLSYSSPSRYDFRFVAPPTVLTFLFFLFSIIFYNRFNSWMSL